MPRDAFDPTESDSPHIVGIQPSHSDLPFACEVLALRGRRPDDEWDEVRKTLLDHAKNTKVEEVATLLRKLECLTGDANSLTGAGATIAMQFRAPTSFDGETSVPIDVKDELTDAESSLFQSLLLEYDLLPMLAVLHQVETESVPTTRDDVRAENFVNRLDHLDGASLRF